MAALLSLATTLVTLLFAFQVARQFARRRKPHQLLWAVAMFFFAAGVAAQFLAEVGGWSPLIYRVWYLSGAILTAAYLGQGTVYLQARRPLAHATMALLLGASLYALAAVWRAPVDVNAALHGPSVSGAGMPPQVRLLTPFFNIYGTVALVVGAARSSWYFLWSGGDNGRALGTGLIATGSLIIATGGTLTRFSVPEALYVSEFAGALAIYLGFVLTSRPSAPPALTREALLQRRRRIARYGVGLGASLLLGAVAILPILPWPMGIVADAQHVFISQVPEENKGAYLVTGDGVMQLFTWRIEPPSFPDDAPTLDRDRVDAVVIVQKQFDEARNYRLYNLTSEQQVSWQAVSTDKQRLQLDPGPLEPGEYMLVVPTDSMFGGKTWHYFRLQ